MPTPVWPVGLRQTYLIGYSDERADERIRFVTDAGPAKIRRRFTNAPRFIKCSDKLTSAQRDTLDTFYTDTLEGGVLEFERSDPHDATVRRFRFLEPPKYTGMVGASGPYYDVSFSLEILPT